MEADDYVVVVKKKTRRGCEFGVPPRHHSAALPTPPSNLQAFKPFPHWPTALLWALGINSTTRFGPEARQNSVMTLLPMPLPSNRE
jgi:hypothetical protein